jgi:hypothetical protein
MIILYKNAARVGYVVDCKIQRVDDCKALAVTQQEAAKMHAEKDCLLPLATNGDDVPCTMRMSPSIHDLPELFLRTERGEWNVLHDKTVYLLPQEETVMQIFTKERSPTCKTPLRLEFVCGDKVFARSESFLVLSKPPHAQKAFPFARASTSDRREVVPEAPSKRVAPWTFFVLGSYRSPEKKRPREEVDEVARLRSELKDARARVSALEIERSGLAKALKLLGDNTQ